LKTGRSTARDSPVRGASKTAGAAPSRDFVRVGRSRIEGKGVFAKRRIPWGTRVIEYTGARVPVTALLTDVTSVAATHVYVFRLSASTAIDGARGGSDARFINHSCDPNCEAYIFDDRVYIYAVQDIARGDELTLDYKLGPVIHGPRSRARAKALYACRCGAKTCRGTMLASRRRGAHS
jgi:SET domain-containing protein